MLTVGSCFSGIGGIELGLERTGGFETKWQIENNPYASAVLAKHWPECKRYGDIRSVDIAGLEPVDLICGGYPCQPFSLAGQRGGASDPRHLWPDMFRIIRALRPRLVLLENVPGHLSMGFGEVLGDLAECGYDAEWGVLSAAGVGAPHLRRRLFVLAYAARDRRGERIAESEIRRREASLVGSGSFVADSQCCGRNGRTRKSGKSRRSESSDRRELGDTASQRLSNGRTASMDGCEERNPILQSERSDWWAIEPNVGRVAHGISKRVDRLKCLGNAVVPQVAEKIGEMILNFEAGKE